MLSTARGHFASEVVVRSADSPAFGVRTRGSSIVWRGEAAWKVAIACADRGNRIGEGTTSTKGRPLLYPKGTG